MRRQILAAFLVAAGAADARAATLDVTVSDHSGKAAPNAIISLESDSPGSAVSHLPSEATIDQRHETFLPLDVIVRPGGRVVFTNNDTTKHQVYSFSPIRQFQFVINEGEVSEPVVFSKPGIAAIGCNIHDQMIAYVFVSDASYAATTDENGHAEISELKPGRYRVAVWHPEMGAQFAPASGTLTVAGAHAEISEVLPVTLEPPHAMKHMHMDY